MPENTQTKYYFYDGHMINLNTLIDNYIFVFFERYGFRRNVMTKPFFIIFFFDLSDYIDTILKNSSSEITFIPRFRAFSNFEPAFAPATTR